MTWLADFHFLRPWWLLALPALLLLLHSQRQRLSQRSAWSQVVDPQLLPHLLQDARQTSSGRGLYPLALLAAILLVTALAGPSWRKLPQPVFDAPLHRVLVMDLSPAMNAQDIKPSRLKRAQLLAQQLLDQQSEGDTGLVAFAADAFPVVPLTSDRDTVSHLLHSLSPDIMPAAGDNLAAGISQAHELLQQAGATQGDIVLITASPVDDAARQAADQARADGFRLNVLGAGTSKGAPVPAAGGWLKDAQGGIQIAKLDEAGLRKLARQHDGHYQRVDQAGAGFELSLQRLKQPLEQQKQDFQADQWQDEGPWFLLPLLLIGALAFRRGWLMLLVLGLPLGVPQTAHAGWWQTDDQQAYEHYQNEDYATAAQTFADDNWRASALYQNGEYEQAAKLWAQQDSAQAAYNQGNALARSGDLEAAIKAYDQALQRDPQLADAQANKALLEKLQQQQKQQQNSESGDQQNSQDQQEQDSSQKDSSGQQGQDQDQQSQSQEDQDQKQDQQSSSGQPSDDDQKQNGQQQQPGDKPPPAEPPNPSPQQAQQKPDETSDDPAQQASAARSAEQQQADEQAQAVQQWLKRIPDDPGGLLRRKFERMEQRRQDKQR